jgi:tetratricopeptide (TPR) repeat protein
MALDNQECVSYIATGDLKYAAKDFSGAIQAYTQALIVSPSAKVFNKRGNAKMNLLLFEESILDFNNAIELDCNLGNSFYLRFIAKIFLNDFAGARDDIKIAKRLDKENSQMYHTFSMFLVENPEIENSNELKKDFITKACPLMS